MQIKALETRHISLNTCVFTFHVSLLTVILYSLTEKLYVNNVVQLEVVRQDWEETHKSTCEVLKILFLVAAL